MTNQSADATTASRAWVAYVGPFRFPWGQAGSRRVYGVARSIVGAGIDVIVCSGADRPQSVETLVRGTSVPAATLRHIGLNELPPATGSSVRKSAQVLVRAGKATAAWLDKQPTAPTHVIVYGGSPAYLYHLGKYCRANNVALVADVVEWYDPTHVRGGRFGPFSLSSALGHRYFHKKADGIIAISEFLSKYYGDLDLPIVTVPPTIDRAALVRLTDRDSFSSTLLNLVYCGTPGRKDDLSKIISAVDLVDPAGTRVRLSVAGPSAQELRSYSPSNRALPPSVRSLGRLDQVEINRVVGSADFSVILREPSRSSNAGFPTKLVESFAAGTPVMANPTSDIATYLKDGSNGFVVKSNSVPALSEVIRKALDLSPVEQQIMRGEAAATARLFGWEEFVVPIAHFLERTKK